MDLSKYKELTMIFHCNKFLNWKKRFPLVDDVPDNELVYIIFDGLLKSQNKDTSLNNALLNAIQFTTLADSKWYALKKETVISWLIEGTKNYENEVLTRLGEFSEIKNIFTSIDVKKNYIVVNICGDRKIDEGHVLNSRIPSTDGIPELIYRSHISRLLRN